MNEFFQKRNIDVEISKKKKNWLKRERFVSVFKQRFKFLKYLIIFFVFYALLFYTPFFLIKNIEINEVKYIDEDALVYDFEALLGENFFLVDLTPSRLDAISKYAFIDNIYTEKLFPNTVIVHVREKEPFAVVSNDQGCFLLDREGFVLLESDCAFLKSNYSVKEVVGSDLNNIDFAVNAQSNFYNIEKIFKVVNVLDYYGYNVKTVLIEGQQIEFLLFDETSFFFSFLGDIDVQLKRFIIVKKKIDMEEIAFKSVDMRYQRPVLIER
jgi:cell division septal protein FtsQ